MLDEKQYEMFIKKLYRKLKRNLSLQSELNEKFKNNEMNLTYHAGWNKGYVDGKITTIEDIIDELELLKNQN